MTSKITVLNRYSGDPRDLAIKVAKLCSEYELIPDGRWAATTSYNGKQKSYCIFNLISGRTALDPIVAEVKRVALGYSISFDQQVRDIPQEKVDQIFRTLENYPRRTLLEELNFMLSESKIN